MKFTIKTILFASLFLAFVSPFSLVYAFDSRGPNIFGLSLGESEHEKITEEALKDLGFLHKKIEDIEDANADVDWKEHSIRWWLIFPVGLKTNKHYNAEHHFDRGATSTSQETFKEGVKYVHQQKADFKQYFKQCETAKALKALGKALHALQDFFAHSNYVDDPPVLPPDEANSKKKWLSDEERKQALEALLDPTKEPPANLELTGYYPNAKEPGNAAGDPYPHNDNAKDDEDSNRGKAKFLEAKKAAIDGTKRFVKNIMKELEGELKGKEEGKDIWSKKTKELFGEEKIFIEESDVFLIPFITTPTPITPTPAATSVAATSVVTSPAKEQATSGMPAAKEMPKIEIVPNQKPIIKGLTVNQLHFSYTERPHRYSLMADAFDPDANLPFTYTWSINCGYFFGPTNFEVVEWRYDVPGECVYAQVTVTATDSLGESDQIVDFRLFQD
ncbi:hypothetical protein COT20_02280 [bacterium (Candidatus Gribaldobacteria) CG08_land_8_20_14_0_20_39_15]|uniref:VWA7 N-terminal domain-containing protein n=1 Tax=bacterium (Candidatus Gribaldobacteria) CG08_land_8_20_14_0_20_39_15 TaxID=2014273 RepID=A0A2M6XUC2_9BACT|nr:MAG: hypothetical protein COT20_02280 [bacterium (Candidatus Gribaldobacteria) CG08_land_8_20_14_0_20_39_15]